MRDIAVLPLGTETPAFYQFDAPSPWRDLPLSYQRKNRWLERHYHGLRWSSGTLPYNTVKEVLLKTSNFWPSGCSDEETRRRRHSAIFPKTSGRGDASVV